MPDLCSAVSYAYGLTNPEKVTIMQLLFSIVLISTLAACTTVRPDPAIFPIIAGGIYSTPQAWTTRPSFTGIHLREDGSVANGGPVAVGAVLHVWTGSVKNLGQPACLS